MFLADNSKDIDALEKLFEALQQNVYFSITTLIGILSVALVISGWALSVLARKWVNDEVAKEMDKLKQDNEEFKLNIIGKVTDLLIANPSVLHARGVAIIQNGQFTIEGFRNFSRDRVLQLDIFSREGILLNKSSYQFTDAPNEKVVISDFQMFEGQAVFWSMLWSNNYKD